MQVGYQKTRQECRCIDDVEVLNDAKAFTESDDFVTHIYRLDTFIQSK